MANKADGQRSPQSRRFIARLFVVLAILVAALWVTWFMGKRTSEETFLQGVLVDLEPYPSDTPRHTELREVLTARLTAEDPALRGMFVSLEYVHFSEFTRTYLSRRNVDFVVLSPQGTPWHRYTDEIGERVDSVKQLLRELILTHDVPVLGICGGHQFLTLAFGGAVGFIDPRLHDAKPEHYPRDALSERGITVLETLQDDPIFDGVVTHPGTFEVVESHYEEVKKVPQPFVNLARSRLSEAQLIRVPGKPVYGTAFHPERGWDSPSDSVRMSPHGKRILANFLLMVSRHRGRVWSGSDRSSFVSR